MTTIFQQKWLESVKAKNSILCAGLDPAEHDMGRGAKGLPFQVSKLEWSLTYLHSVAPFVAGVKPNLHYWTHFGDLEDLKEITYACRRLNLPCILDAKVADIGSTNDAAFYHAVELGFDAITFSPFAGNLEEAVKQAHNSGIGLISMCLMSNREYALEKNKLVRVVEGTKEFDGRDVVYTIGMPNCFVPQYVHLAQRADKFGADGVVIGVTNHVTEKEVSRVAHYFRGLSLSPGLGAQGGAADAVIKNYGDRVIANVGRALMFPKGSDSSPQQQADAALQYKERLNILRK